MGRRRNRLFMAAACVVPSVLVSAGCFPEPVMAEDLSPARNKKPDVPVRYNGCTDSDSSWKHFSGKYPYPLPPDSHNINYCLISDFQSTAAWLRFEAEEPGVRQFLERIGAPQEQTVVYTDPEHYNFQSFVPADLVLGRTYGRTDVDRGPAGTSGSRYLSHILIDRDGGAPHTVTVFINVFAV